MRPDLCAAPTAEMPPAGEREIFLYFSSVPEKNRRHLRRFKRAAQQAGLDFAVIGFLNNGHGGRRELRDGEQTVPQFLYTPLDALSLGYPGKAPDLPLRFIPGNCDLPVLLFWRAHPQYKRLWVMEDDVDYSGNPAQLIAALKGRSADLMATHLHRCQPDWKYLHMLRSPGVELRPEQLRLCFLPFFVANQNALEAIDAAYRAGWHGHHELTWPTILNLRGLHIVDIGGQGPFVEESDLNRHYLGHRGDEYLKLGSFGTMKVRFRPGRHPNMLWHPVKRLGPWMARLFKRYWSVYLWYRGRHQRHLNPESGWQSLSEFGKLGTSGQNTERQKSQ